MCWTRHVSKLYVARENPKALYKRWSMIYMMSIMLNMREMTSITLGEA